MNVDILESNPDWRWYLLFGGGCLSLTGFVWLLAKYGQVSVSHFESVENKLTGRLTKWIKECLNACYRLQFGASQIFRQGFKSGQLTLPK